MKKDPIFNGSVCMGIIWGFSQDIGRYGMGIGIEIQSPQQPRFYFIYNVLCLRFTQRKYV